MAAPVAEAAEPQRLDFSATLAVGQAVAIDNPYGDVRLRFGGFAHALQIHAVLQQPAEAAPIAVQPRDDSGRYRFAPRLPAGAIAAEGQRLDVVAFIPRGHAVSVHTEQGLIESHGVNMVLFPSIWPETFSYVVGELTHMAVPIVAFDLGAPAERLRTYAHARLVAEVSAEAALDTAIAFHRERSERRASAA